MENRLYIFVVLLCILLLSGCTKNTVVSVRTSGSDSVPMETMTLSGFASLCYLPEQPGCKTNFFYEVHDGIIYQTGFVKFESGAEAAYFCNSFDKNGNALKNRKFNFKAFSYFVVSSVGYATILFSPGTFTRAGDQGELSAANLMTNFITILRKRWLDNLCIVVFLLAVNFFVVYWLVKFRNVNKITSKINIPVSAAVSVLTVMNLLLKVILVLMKFTGKPVSFSHSLNMVLFAVWIFTRLCILPLFCMRRYLYIKKTARLIR